MKTYVTKQISKSSNKEYLALVGEKNGSRYFLTFDRNTIARILDYSPSMMDSIKVGDVIEI